MLNGLDKIEGLTPEMAEQINALASGLSNKNSELLEKLSGKEGITAAEKAKLTELEQFKNTSDIANAKAAQDWQTASDLQAAQWKIEAEAKDLQIAEFKKGESTRLITDGARKQLTDLGVNPLHMEAQMALITGQSQIVDSKAMIGDQTQSDYIKAWSATDSGKASIIGQQNSNGDGNGGANKAPDTSANKAADDAKAKGDVQGYLKAVQAQAQQ